MNQVMIEAIGLTKYYSDLKAISGITFSISKGEIVGFLGPNAAGKTTTMRILSCYLSATEGRARVAGYDVFEESHEVKKRLGYLPERPPLYTDMPVEKYLRFVCEIKGVARNRISGLITDTMDKCGISSVRNVIISHLSKGYRQRVGLAQAIVHNPDVLILDEPTAGLDPCQIKEVREVIRNLKGEHTIILSTHILPEVTATCDRVIVIDRGVLVADDSIENLTRHNHIVLRVKGPTALELTEKVNRVKGVMNVSFAHGKERLQRFPEDPNSNETVSLLIEHEPSTEIAPELARLVVESHWNLLELRRQETNLEEVFLKLVTAESLERAGEEKTA